MPRTLIICGSPLISGRSMQLATLLSEKISGKSPQNEAEIFSVANHAIDGCIACDGCKESYECVVKDDMQQLYPLLNQADELIIVSPIYFAGPPAQLKAVLDRLQPYFWKWLDENRATKRPAKLYVLGDAVDPHGFLPLVRSVLSALAVARFSLEKVYDCRKLDQKGLIDVADCPNRYLVEEKGFDCTNPPGFSGEGRA